MSYVNLDGVRLYFEEAGAGQSLILIHGASQDTLSWQANFEALAPQYHVHAIDLPGHGKSGVIGGRPTRSTQEHAAWIGKFIRARGLHKPILIGHSLGAAVAITVALDFPEMVAGVVAVDGGAAFRGAAGVNYRGTVLTDAEINPSAWLETSILSVLGRTTPHHRRREMAFDATRCSPYVQYADLITYTSFSFNERLHEVRVPIYYIIGEDDWSTTPEVVRDTTQRLAANGVRTDCIVLEGLGHIPHWEQPARFNVVLAEVLSRFPHMSVQR